MKFSRIAQAGAVVLVVAAVTALWWPRRASHHPSPGVPPSPASVPQPSSSIEPVSPSAPRAGAGGTAADNLATTLQVLAGESTTRMEEFIATMSVAELESALTRLWDQAGNGDLPNLLLRRWAEETPQAASVWLMKQVPGDLRRAGAIALATVWANHNAADAAAWARQLPPDEMEPSVMAIGYELARTSPKDALWLAAALPPNPSRNGLIDHAVGQWAALEPEAPSSWAEQIPASPLRDQVFASLATSMSETDPTGAADMALEKLPPGTLQNDAIVRVVQRWAQQTPADAAEWVRQFPEGVLQTSATENLLQVWAAHDSEAAGTWVGALEPGPMRDIALSAYASHLMASDPAAAIDWAQKISDGPRRQVELERLGERWIASDRSSARSWVRSAGLPDASKTRLLAIPEPSSPRAD